MAPVRGAFTKLVTTDTSVESLVVGGATGASTTGTGGIIAGNAALNAAATPLIAPLTVRGGGAAGSYTTVNSALIFKNGADAELWRLYGTGSGSANHRNLYLGFQAGLAQPTDNTTAGSSNIGIGTHALKSITQGDNNLAIGETALEDLTTGSSNLAVGVSALANVTTADNNVALGLSALASLVTGTSNTAIGESALGGATGNNNTALGYRALISHIVGDQNTALGTFAFAAITTTTASNVAVGYNAGRFITGGTPLTQATQSIYVGASTRGAVNNQTNEIVIGYNADGQGSNTIVIGNSSATTIYTPPTMVNKVDASNFSTLAVSAAGAVTLTATGASAGYTFASALTMAAPMLLTGEITPTELAANTDNWNPTGLSTANVIRVSSSGAINLTGIVAQASGRMIVLYNAGAFDITLVHDSTSTAANRFFCPNAANNTLSQKETTWLRYDGTDSRWTVMGSV